MGMIDAAARLPIHQRDFAVFAFIIGDDGLEVADLQFLAGRLRDCVPKHVEHLPLIEPIHAVAARGSERHIQIVEDHVLL